MWRKVFLIPLACFMAMPILATDVEVRLKAEQSRIILGEPLSMVITVQNTSGRTLDLPFEPIFAGTAPAVLVGNSGGGVEMSTTGAAMMCEEVGTTITAPFAWKMGDGFDIVIPLGQAISFASQLRLPAPLRDKPGIYNLMAHYEARGPHLGQEGAVVGGTAPREGQYVCQACWKGTVDSASVTITVDAPSGADADAYQAFKGNPLAHFSELLQRFPTSTYAGYALVKLGPASTMWAVAQQTLEQRDIELGIPAGAPREAQERYRATQRTGREEFVKKAERFLAAHPDFAQADLLRKEVATALFLLDRPDEAFTEVRKIKATEGPLAEEAKRTLEEAEKRAAPNPKK